MITKNDTPEVDQRIHDLLRSMVSAEDPAEVARLGDLLRHEIESSADIITATEIFRRLLCVGMARLQRGFPTMALRKAVHHCHAVWFHRDDTHERLIVAAAMMRDHAQIADYAAVYGCILDRRKTDGVENRNIEHRPPGQPRGGKSRKDRDMERPQFIPVDQFVSARDFRAPAEIAKRIITQIERAELRDAAKIYNDAQMAIAVRLSAETQAHLPDGQTMLDALGRAREDLQKAWQDRTRLHTVLDLAACMDFPCMVELAETASRLRRLVRERRAVERGGRVGFVIGFDRLPDDEEE